MTFPGNERGVTVENKVPTAALLSYLQPFGTPFHLGVSLIPETLSDSKRTYPFLVITGSDPLTHLIEARIMTDAGSEISKLCLLVQKDQYLLPKDSLRRVTNRTIDASWQKAFSFFTDEKTDSHLIIFSTQISEKRELKPFQPLFFCKMTQRFFAPPCPQCGSPLEQCHEDSLLARLGLSCYSTSLKRYLYCPACCREKVSGFYVFELDGSDPPGVGDRSTLIKDFGSPLKRGERTFLLPCVECFRNPECFGLELRALTRIVPFSFYSFYMLAFEALSLSWQMKEFFEGLDHLRQGVRGGLFREEAVEVSPVVSQAKATEDEAIYAILSKFVDQNKADRAETEDLKETVVLAPGAKTDLPSPPADGGKEREIMAETVLTLPPSEFKIEKGPEEAKAESVPTFKREGAEQDFMTETVILGQIGLSPGSSSFGSRGTGPPLGNEVGPSQGTGKEPPREPPEEDDILAETVVIKPGKGQEKKGK